ncbi:unnamed protein product, partial [marine sediment metagenome]
CQLYFIYGVIHFLNLKYESLSVDVFYDFLKFRSPFD